MSTLTHPSPEKLNAYFDQELTQADRSSIDSHLQTCSACRSELDWFGLLTDLGQDLEESLPGESYWKDLPDRILTRAAESPETVSVSGPSFWGRLWNPQGTWRYAVGAAVSFALIAGLWFLLREQPDLFRPDTAVNQEPSPVATNTTTAPSSPVLEEDNLFAGGSSFGQQGGVPPMSPESFTNRVMMTFGQEGDYGRTLDIQPGMAATPSRGSGIGTQVTNMLPPLSPRMMAAAKDVVAYGCGEDPLQDAFLAALKAEESGDYRMAAQGYQIIRASLPSGQALRHEAEYRLTCLAWQLKMERETAWNQRAKAMSELNRLANRTYKVWEQTKLSQDCQKAWCMNRVLLTLAPEVTSGLQLQLTSSRMNQLKNCVE
jgi:hypothetical protein